MKLTGLFKRGAACLCTAAILMKEYLCSELQLFFKYDSKTRK